MRVTNRTMIDNVRASITAATERLDRVQREIASGRRLNRPSDDPAATAVALRLRTDLETSEQYGRTIAASRSRLSAADAALGSLTGDLQRARELALEGGSGALGAEQLRSLGTEVNQLLLQTVQIGNSNFSGQYLFAGTKTTTVPFSAAGAEPASVTYNGNASAIVQDLGQGVQINVDVRGDTLFGPVAEALIKLRDLLNAGDGAAVSTTGLAALDDALDGTLQVQGTIGARVNRLESLDVRLEDERINLEGIRSSVEDADLADTIIRLNTARTTYEAALGAAARAIQPSLMDYLR
jgi:flagellar hook-associated protein 3 FlgL